MTTITAALAHKLAAVGSARIGQWDDETLRDWLDHKTAGDLDCTQLDLLLCWVRTAHRGLSR